MDVMEILKSLADVASAKNRKSLQGREKRLRFISSSMQNI